MARVPGARVLIVGAGPAGAGLALALAHRGQGHVELVEAAPEALGRFRGEGLMPSGLEALERLEAWPLPDAVPHRPLSGWSFQLEGRPLFDVAEPFGAGPACHLIDQPSLLQHLLTRAEAAGCRLHLGQAVVALVRDRGRVSGVELADGRRLEADLVVACDGRSSTLRRLAGLPLEEEADPLRVLWFRLSGPAGDVGLTAADMPLLWKGARPLAFLRTSPLAGGTRVESLVLNWDLASSTAARTAAVVVMLQRFVERVRERIPRGWADNFETGQAIPLPDGRQTRAPEAPGFFAVPLPLITGTVRQAVTGAAHFADARECDFRDAAPVDTLDAVRMERITKRAVEDPWAALWVAVVAAALLVAWGWNRKP